LAINDLNNHQHLEQQYNARGGSSVANPEGQSRTTIL